MVLPMRRAAVIGISFLISLAPFLVPLPALAYSGLLQIALSPQYPRPGEAVTLTAEGYPADTLTYVWSVDGEVVLQGIDQKVLPLPAENAGNVRLVTLSAIRNGTAVDAATATVRPESVDLLWEGETSVPPFYIGRPLPNAQSGVTVIAVPHIIVGKTELPANGLVYTWKQDGIPIKGSSGYGRSSVTLVPPTFGQPFVVSVHVETLGGTAAAEESVTITPQSPRLIVYEDAPLLGIRFEKTVPSAFRLGGDEISFSAFPVFAGNPASLAYRWTLDGTPFSVDPARPGDVTFRKVGTESGSHPISVSFTNPGQFLEKAMTSFTLTF